MNGSLSSNFCVQSHRVVKVEIDICSSTSSIDVELKIFVTFKQTTYYKGRQFLEMFV